MTALAASLQTYFTASHNQRDLSSNTIGSYRDTWRMLLKYLTATLEVSVEALDFDAVTATNITGFLDYLEHERGNGAKTRNVRLTAIRSVLSRALPDHPEHAATITQVLAIPPKRTTRPVIEFLTPEEVVALLDAPDPTTWTGRRDRTLLALTVQTGLRIGEACSLTIDDIHLGTGAHVTCTGKGRRQRITPLTRTTASAMTAYLTERSERPGTALFCGPRGLPLSRDALEHRLAKHVATAASTCPGLTRKHVTMHTLRHTAAMNLLAAGVDIAVIALWLGHADTHSTDAYLHADMAIKQAALDRTRPPDVEPGVYRPEPDILAWLASL
ncbi:site-specific integrase [Nocardioides hungaricus]